MLGMAKIGGSRIPFGIAPLPHFSIWEILDSPLEHLLQFCNKYKVIKGEQWSSLEFVMCTLQPDSV